MVLDKAAHAAACGAVTLLAARLLPAPLGFPQRATCAALAGLAVGALKEGLDYGGYLPGAADAMDGLADAAGCVGAVLLMAVWRRGAAGAAPCREAPALPLPPRERKGLPV